MTGNLTPFNRPYLTGYEQVNILDASARGQLSGDGFYTHQCHHWLESNLHCKRALLTHSCTAALEMAAILLDIRPGDEVIMPSFTFVSTANAFVIRGAVPVFVDIRPDTQNINEELIEQHITERTKAIVVVHYAGIPCDMRKILQLSSAYHIPVVEDAAQAILSTYDGNQAGTMGALGCLSFHETKNIISGEGGALLINDDRYLDRAEVIREKGTNRSAFFRGEVAKYSWVDVGSSYLPGEMTAAFLFAQLLHSQEITSQRRKLWYLYHEFFLQSLPEVVVPFVPEDIMHNAHMFYLKLSSSSQQAEFIDFLRSHGIQSVFHYRPLHSSSYATDAFSINPSSLPHTNHTADTLVRLPLWIGLDLSPITKAVLKFFSKD